MAESSENTVVKDVKREFRSKLIAAVVAGLLAGLAASGIALWRYAEQLSSSVVIPSNAVVAFYGGCPNVGWKRFWPATSRVIVGAANQDEMGEIPANFARTDDDQILSPRAERSVGGRELVKLSFDNLPSHDHTYTVTTTAAHINSGISASNLKFGGDAGLAPTTTNTSQVEGKSEAIQNMQPYLALSYCIKD